MYIPEVDVYPDMVKEKWTLSKVQDFAKENNLTLDITYKETTDVEEKYNIITRKRSRRPYLQWLYSKSNNIKKTRR
ncbi:MAG: hypothetical protein L6V91_00460 [Bacilli bacterium]|nr:MAG: hypothetical protein L6V91_00460 [Bacilli bacterium]